MQRPPASVAACEAEIRDQLAAPSTYRTVQYRIVEERPSPEEYAAINPPPNSLPADLKKLWIDAAKEPIRRIILIDYDVSNTAGVPIRGQYACDYVLSDRAKEISDTDILIRRTNRTIKSLGVGASRVPE